MVWLVVSAEFDEAARWAVDLLPSAGIEPVLHVTDADLGGAIWDHRIEVDGGFHSPRPRRRPRDR